MSDEQKIIEQTEQKETVEEPIETKPIEQEETAKAEETKETKEEKETTQTENKEKEMKENEENNEEQKEVKMEEEQNEKNEEAEKMNEENEEKKEIANEETEKKMEEENDQKEANETKEMKETNEVNEENKMEEENVQNEPKENETENKEMKENENNEKEETKEVKETETENKENKEVNEMKDKENNDNKENKETNEMKDKEKENKEMKEVTQNEEQNNETKMDEEPYPTTLEPAPITVDKTEKLLGNYKYCRFCGGEPYETNVSYLPITNGRVGNFPIVLNCPAQNNSNYICLHHWRENRREYLEHHVQNEKTVIDEASVLLYASMLDKNVNFGYVPQTQNIPEDTKDLFSKYLSLRRKELQMAMGSVPAGLSVTSDLLCNACGAPTQQMFDMSLFPPSFVQFLAWQRLMQIYSKLDATNMEMLTALKKEGLREAKAIVDEARDFATHNPNDARKRLQPEYSEKPQAKRPIKQEPQQPFSLPPIESAGHTNTQQSHQLPPIVSAPKTEQRRNLPSFVEATTETPMLVITKPKIIIGRRGRENEVDLDLSKYMEARSISHTHATVEWDNETKKWMCYLKGRNGLKIDTMFKNRDSATELHNNSVIETGTFKFMFKCPEDFDGTF